MTETKYGRIYIIKNTVNDKVYVGQTYMSIKLRFANHLSAARRGLDYVIGKAIRKYGAENFYVELLEECLIEELNEREIYWIKFFNSADRRFGYNMSIGGHVIRTTKPLDELYVINLFNNGKTSCAIAKELHVHPYRIADILKKHNITYGVDKLRTNATVENMILDLYLLGYSTVDLSHKFNLNKSTVRRILKRRGIILRTHKETTDLKRNLSTLN